MPNVDLIKLAKIVGVVAVVLVTLAAITAIFSPNSAAGTAAIRQLGMNPEGVNWSPADVASVLFPILMGQPPGGGVDFYGARGAPSPGPIWGIITGAFGAAFVAAGAILLLKIIMWAMK